MSDEIKTSPAGEEQAGQPGEQGTTKSGAESNAEAGKEKDPKKGTEKTFDAEKVLKAQAKELAGLKGLVSELQEQIKLLTASPDAKLPEEPKIPKEGFKVDGEEYFFTVPVLRLKGGLKRTALEALSDNESHDALGGLTIKAFLVANNSSMIRKG